MMKDWSADVKRNVNNQIFRALTALGINGVNIAKTNCTVDMAGLRGSITKEVEGQTVRVGTNMEYAPYVEGGSAPHKTNVNSADFIENITAWCQRHGIENPYLVIRHIRRYGTAAHPFLRPSFDETEMNAPAIILRYLSEVGGGV